MKLLSKEVSQRNRSADVIKGLSTLFVILLHSEFYENTVSPIPVVGGVLA